MGLAGPFPLCLITLLLLLPTTIDGIIARLAEIIQHCAATNHRAGYFAVLYHRVTVRIKECIAQRRFEDGARMEKLDVIFATRYLAAYDAWRAGRPLSASWRTAFDGASADAPLVLQHLLLGINAHINLDLGIAAAETMKGSSIGGIRKDFYAINDVLAELVEVSQRCLMQVNPLLKLLQLHRYNADEMLVNFSIGTARDGAWAFAQEVAGKSGVAYDACVAARDACIAQLGKTVAQPRSRAVRATIGTIRFFEKRRVSDVIQLLGAS